jgi:hypothetical protein
VSVWQRRCTSDLHRGAVPGTNWKQAVRTSVSERSQGSTDHGDVRTDSSSYQYCTSTANKEVISINYIIKFVTWSINGKQCSIYQFIYQTLVCLRYKAWRSPNHISFFAFLSARHIHTCTNIGQWRSCRGTLNCSQNEQCVEWACWRLCLKTAQVLTQIQIT